MYPSDCIARIRPSVDVWLFSPAKLGWRTEYRHVVLGLIMGYISLDESISIHEMLNDPLRASFELGGPLYFGWVIPAAILVIIVFLFYLRFLRELPRRTALLMFTAGALYVTGALGMELFEGVIRDRGEADTMLFWMLSTVEELLELGSIALFIFSLTDYASRHCSRLGSIFGHAE